MAGGMSSPLHGEPMGYGYPIVLRQNAVEAYQAGRGSIEEIAVVFGIGSATLKRWLWRKRDDNTLAPRPYGAGNKRKLSEADIEWMASRLPERCDWKVQEWRDALEKERHIGVSRSAVNRAMLKQGWRQKKVADRLGGGPSRCERTSSHYGGAPSGAVRW